MPPGAVERDMTALVLDSQLDDLLFGCLRRDITPLVQHQTVGDALALIRSQGLGERIVYFYVVDDDERLVGVIPTRRKDCSKPSGSRHAARPPDGARSRHAAGQCDAA